MMMLCTVTIFQTMSFLCFSVLPSLLSTQCIPTGISTKKTKMIVTEIRVEIQRNWNKGERRKTTDLEISEFTDLLLRV